MRYLLVATLLASAAWGCTKNVDTTPTPADAAAAASTPPPHPGVTWNLSIEAKGTAHVDVSSAALHIAGDTTASMGSLVVTPTDLARSRGAVMVDLASLSVHGSEDAGDAQHTKDAAAWLGLVGDAGGSTSSRWASFAIQSIDALSADDLTKVSPSKDGSSDIRTVTMTLHGDLLLHGHKVQKDAVVEVSFVHPAGAAVDAKLVRVDITSKRPIELVLKDFDARPSDASRGNVSPSTAKGSASVASSANVTFHLSATPSSS